ncbi:MAG: hypothetical protein SNJ72_04105 [Fimbriimonadales bacterium]
MNEQRHLHLAFGQGGGCFQLLCAVYLNTRREMQSDHRAGIVPCEAVQRTVAEMPLKNI